MSDRPRKVLIVGGVAGGMSAATRLRRLDESAEIVVFERSWYVSFANCGLPYHVSGVIEDRQALLLQTPESLGRRFGIDVRVGHEVVSIDRDAKRVSVRDLNTDRITTESYDTLILSPGAAPFVPDIPGAERALTLRNIADVDKMVAAVGRRPHTAVVVGGGFIGIEVAENLQHLGIDVTVVEMADQLLAPLDPEMAAYVAQQLVDNGIEVLTGNEVVAIGEKTVTLGSGDELPADMVVMSIGVRPDSHLAKDAGLEVNGRGGIVVDEYQRTSDPDIFAVGDAAEKRDAVSGEAAMVPLAQTANRHGRLVADVIVGRRTTSKPVLGTAIVGVFGLMAASVGWNEKRLRAAGRNYRAIHAHPGSHAGYYPGSEALHLKLLVDADTDEILGAQAIGKDGADKRIDVIATAMRGGLKGADLADLELAYAPQFGSAKDPINMLGFIDDNVVNGQSELVQWHEVEAARKAGIPLVDVRTPGEFRRGHIPGSINLPVDELRNRLDEVPAGDLVITCQVGLRGHVAERILRQAGHQVRNLTGGYQTWSTATRPLAKPAWTESPAEEEAAR
ncbi:NADPH-dependent 2,4-dienoyl-CoA reductase, sulfur reductase [Raineyella antarctica]|uniref:NADPH-dependent 2,4-dienoyl-CoA reductase, sulfur reductase n=1 Tax=Raineyella antarctica TaxID=1577474 RepID=A0A1G6GER8_9ACTN|nr:FAD-dependent oxidoreductase [Raineyella antarctica]SDB80501.1 NADPH-dependent 2,4-dienoyl-CoA reductase, sulfur reductase [Raineyella antarctica]